MFILAVFMVFKPFIRWIYYLFWFRPRHIE